jgi:hypothetical protein
MIIMKCLIVILLSFLVVAPLQANTDAWNDYLHVLNNFYTLDQQNFSSISCKIEVPIINNNLSQIHSQFSQFRDKIVIKENLATFSLIYRKSGGLTIYYPSLDIRIISEKGIADPAKVRKGIEMVKTGFKQQVEGVGEQLKGIFEGFETPKKNHYKMEEVKNDNSVYTVKYEKDNSHFTEIYSDNQRKVIVVDSNGGKISSIENYEKAPNGKLVPRNAHVTIDQQMAKMEMDLSISYEELKAIYFPTHVASHFNQSIQTMRQEGQVDIFLKNCTLK